MQDDGLDSEAGAGGSGPALPLSRLAELGMVPPQIGQTPQAGGLLSPAGLQAALLAGLAAQQQQMQYQRALLGLHQQEALLAAWSKMAAMGATPGPSLPAPVQSSLQLPQLPPLPGLPLSAAPPQQPGRTPAKPDHLARSLSEPGVSASAAALAALSAAVSSPSRTDGSPPGSAPRPTTSGRSSSREKVFTCQVCNRSFGYKHVLQNHERTHTGEKPFECKECHKRFTRDHHLKTHMRLHTGEKPYHCAHCDRQFVQVANLRRHLRVHTGERPYACEMCDAKFSDSNQLKAHMLIHNGEKPFRCPDCHGSFRRRHHLVHHKCPARPEMPEAPEAPADAALTTFDHLPEHLSPGESPVSETRSEASSVDQRYEQPLTATMTSGAIQGEQVRKHVRKASETRRVVRTREETDVSDATSLSASTDALSAGFSMVMQPVPEQTEPEDLSICAGRPSQSSQGLDLRPSSSSANAPDSTDMESSSVLSDTQRPFTPEFQQGPHHRGEHRDDRHDFSMLARHLSRGLPERRASAGAFESQSTWPVAAVRSTSEADSRSEESEEPHQQLPTSPSRMRRPEGSLWLKRFPIPHERPYWQEPESDAIPVPKESGADDLSLWSKRVEPTEKVEQEQESEPMAGVHREEIEQNVSENEVHTGPKAMLNDEWKSQGQLGSSDLAEPGVQTSTEGQKVIVQDEAPHLSKEGELDKEKDLKDPTVDDNFWVQNGEMVEGATVVATTY